MTATTTLGRVFISPPWVIALQASQRRCLRLPEEVEVPRVL